ncbi:MAG: hypothetical protein Q8P67_06105 [archaeon]|nr:hypothetical protein [archaeon]
MRLAISSFNCRSILTSASSSPSSSSAATLPQPPSDSRRPSAILVISCCNPSVVGPSNLALCSNQILATSPPSSVIPRICRPK